MLAVLLALGSAVAYGASDFLAGWLSRRMGYARVALVSQLTAAGGTLVASLLVGGRAGTAGLSWGAISGLGGGLGTLALYRGLAHGRMSVVAPLSGVLAAGIPALAGLAMGERPSVPAAIGLVLAMPAVWLVSSAAPGGDRRPNARSVVDGVLAGLGFAVLFIALQRAGRGAGLWPTATSQLASGLVMVLFHLGRSARPDGLSPTPDRSAWVRVGPLAIGVIGTAAIILYFLATRQGLLSVVAVLTSLYPAFTVALARWLLAERIGRRQGAGLALAGVAVALISAA
jgi:uncharacterized membrane protein